MEFDWVDVPFELKEVTPREIEESFEDPFALRLLPDDDKGEREARYFCLGKSIQNRAIFSVFWTDGKNYRSIFSRDMTVDESTFYERKNAEFSG
ncbi:MAG: BrnT family toxin [Verrucomicrobiales bacterium]